MSNDEKFIKVTVNMAKSKHRKLKAIAALKDIGLSAYIMECLERVVFREKEYEEVNAENSLVDGTIKEVEELIEAKS